MTAIRKVVVYLIGAGPGDPGLITVRGAELIGRADAILYDGLANEALLQYASPEAEKICVGKHGHGGTWGQSQIDDEVVRLARQGKTVARLKGGDTAIFARTAEEVDRLLEENIPYEIVPGITAALAASAFTGIPITHRDWSSAVALVTGRLQPADGSEDAEESLDWNALGKFPGTLVLYMGVTTASHWSSKLIEAGKPASTPVAMIRRCSWPDQQVFRCELGTVAATIAAMPGLRPPIISIVGEVIRMAKTLDWFTTRPWFGRRVWVTSPKNTAEVLAKKFAEQGAEVFLHPVMTIEPPLEWQSVDAILRALDQYEWIVFSSVYGVEGFFERLRALGLDGRSLHQAKIASVGSGTAAAIARYSMHCDMIPQVPGADALAELLAIQCEAKNFLFVRSPEGETTAMHRLERAGAFVESLNIYRQVLVASLSESWLKRVESGEIHAITATSKNIATQTVALLGDLGRNANWLSMSPAITASLKELGCKNVQTAREPSFEALVQLTMDT
jgi:uroporphyrinogen III methyltransferase / synthase